MHDSTGLTGPRVSARDYRPDIDGLRAVAVMVIIVFHLDPGWLPGGFVGVDIFFVISGYLITGILARELREGSFTFWRFYERRIRRILPALWVLLVVCIPVSFVLMLPQDGEAMGKSALWSSLAMANVYFWREVSTDYFEPQSATLPFLHLWSLGVEEQFYLIWPAAMFAIWRLGRRRAPGIAIVVAAATVLASTLLAEYLLAHQQSRFAYYMLPARAGELAIGAVISLVRMQEPSSRRTFDVAGTAAAIGWLLLLYSMFLLSEDDPFPGWRALLPTLGAAALIVAGGLAPNGGLLAPLRSRPAQWLGRCSFSAYLWHWPVLAWWRYLWGEPGVISKLILLALVLAIARGSQKWIEDPVRRSHAGWPRTVLKYGVLPLLLVGTLALLVARGERWGIRLYSTHDRAAWKRLEAFVGPAHRTDWVCQQHVLDPASLFDSKCEFGSGREPARIFLMGDSHAAEFAPLFRIAAEAQGVQVRSVALGGCAPLYGSLRGLVEDSRVSACEQGIEQVLRRARDFPLLIVGAGWDSYANRDSSVWWRLESQLLELTSRGHQVWLLPRVPSFTDFDAACPEKRVRVGDWLRCPTSLVPRNTGDDPNARLYALAQRIPGVRFLPLHEPLCRASTCIVADEAGNYLYADPSHLSVHGAKVLAAELIRGDSMPNLLEPLRLSVDSSQSAR